MKKLLAIVCIISIFCLSFGGCTKGSSPKDEEKAVSFSLDECLYPMAEELSGFTAALNGKVIKFPLSFEDFSLSGWKISAEDKSKTLKSGQYGIFRAELEKSQIGLYFANFSDEEKPLRDCAVCGASAQSDGSSVIELPKNIILGKSTKSEIIKAFGEAEYSDGEFRYAFDEGGEVILRIQEDKLSKIDIKKIADPLYLNASSEVPEIVKNYKAPKELSTDIKDFTFYLYGKTYTMPLPVSVLIENGWILAAKTDEYILPGEILEGAVKLTTLNRTLTFDVKNLADYPTTPENCFITSIESKYDMKLDMVLGVSWVRVGGSESSIINTFGEKDFTKNTTKKKTEYIYEDPETGKITITAKEGYISKIRIELA